MRAMTPTTAAVTGATGLVGSALVGRLARPVVLSRDPDRAARALGPVPVARWEPLAGPPPLHALHGAGAVFHLAGEPIARGRWTAAKRRRIRDSRVVGTRNLVAALAGLDPRPQVLVSASAIGYYGDRGDQELDESAGPGGGFLAEVCAAWEREAMAAAALGVRVVCARIGVVLAPRGGVLAPMLRPFKLGVGGPVGGGSQWMSWIHIDDLVGLLLHARHCRDLAGAMNAVSPHPVRNREFARALGNALHRPARLTAPRAALRLAFGGLSELITDSERAVPRVATESGYVFKHPDLDGALRDVLAPSDQPRAA